MTSEQSLEERVKSLEEAVGVLIACLVRIGVEGRPPIINDCEALGIPVTMHIGYPEKGMEALKRYRDEAAAAG